MVVPFSEDHFQTPHGAGHFQVECFALYTLPTLSWYLWREREREFVKDGGRGWRGEGAREGEERVQGREKRGCKGGRGEGVKEGVKEGEEGCVKEGEERGERREKRGCKGGREEGKKEQRELALLIVGI